MSEIGDLLDSHSDTFDRFLADEIEMRNFTEGDMDARRDRAKVVDEGASGTVEATVSQDTTPQEVSGPGGESHVVDATIILDDGHTVSDGTDDRPQPTEFVRPGPSGNRWVVVSVFNEGNGALRCACVNAGSD